MSGETLAALMFPCLFVFVLLGLPISFSLLVTAAIFAWPLFGDAVANQLYAGISQTASSFVLSAVPPFIFMGFMLERSGVAERLFAALQLWLGRLPGGLALATMGMAGILAAATGIVGAVEVLIGVMAIPAMMARGYDKRLISGVICAGGSLGTMIPPSIVVVIYATVAQISVGQLFAAVMLPGIIMIALFAGYVLGAAFASPRMAPAEVSETQVPLGEKLRVTGVALVPMVALIVAVLGSISFGIASPTEAASVGALGTVLLTIAYGRFTWATFTEALRQTMLVNAMILLIVVGGTIFAGTFRIHGGNGLVRDLLEATGFGQTGIILVMLLVVFIAGFILDWVSVVLICLPIFVPVLSAFQIEPLWFAVLMIVVIQTSYLTPPMAPSIFYLRSIAPPDITYRDMYWGVVPFILAQLATLALIFAFPALATWLPGVLID
ncbi:C4-dicarboxylate ABC transporter permease [Rhodovulum sp. 12E13]|uniref:TRAP transporter large permease n=1 Tax=Rhodovulum sp. 12E13 TaxID=2203891 RepID=UPI000E11A560|nr:TRAP transporter large permease subunit [Rhodovulum sp. 12E13]RDC73664.1 C4-dicarboxylate ABC transporter permease [Rhodovulum sp. 12E13]